MAKSGSHHETRHSSGARELVPNSFSRRSRRLAPHPVSIVSDFRWITRRNSKELRRVIRTNDHKMVTVFGNQPAASISNAAQLPYPDGSILVMETALALDAQGAWQKGNVTGLHVMHKEQGFGGEYGQNQTGEWEYAEYAPDRTYITPPSNPPPARSAT